MTPFPSTLIGFQGETLYLTEVSSGPYCGGLFDNGTSYKFRIEKGPPMEPTLAPAHIAPSYNPLNGDEVLRAMMTKIWDTLKSHETVFSKALTYENPSFTFSLHLDAYTQETRTINGKGVIEPKPISADLEVKAALSAPDTVRRENNLPIPRPTMTGEGIVDIPLS